MKINDINIDAPVKVIGRKITGVVKVIHRSTSEIVICDDATHDELVFKPKDLEPLPDDMAAKKKTVNKLTDPSHPIYQIVKDECERLCEDDEHVCNITKEIIQRLQRDGHIRYTAKKHTNADTVNESPTMKSRRRKTEYIAAHIDQNIEQMFDGMQHMGIIKKNANKHDNILSITRIKEKLEMEAA